MRYWWVNQNQTYRHEIQGGYLWSPKRNANGARNPFYESMREVAPGDLIFSFMDTRGSPSNIVATRSGNWSGFVDFDSSKPFAKGAIYAYWIVPRAQLAFGATSGNVDSSSWVGLDGYS